VGKDRSFPALAGAILPGQSVDITVNAPGVPEKGGIPCAVRLRYDNETRLASWAGTVDFPAPSKRLIPTGPHSYALVPTSSGAPLWAWLIGGLLTALLLVALAILMLLLRRPRLAGRSPR
jgi:hypothetical protein